MTYFLLPKSHSLFNIVPTVSNSLTTESCCCCSHSLGLLYEKIQPQFENLTQYPENTLHTKSELFNDLLEIINTTNLFDSKVNLDVLHVGKNSADTTDCLRMVRGLPSTYEVDSFDNIVNDEQNPANNNIRYDFLCIENESSQSINDTHINSYIINMFKGLMVVLKHQKEGGSCIIKIYHTVHKPIIEFLYILTFLFNKISIIKPKTSDPTSCTKYIVCKNFLLTLKNKDFYLAQYSKIANFIDFTDSYLKHDVPNIISLIDQAIPYYFINKIDDVNVIIGQQQLEHMNQTISSGKHLGTDMTKKPKLNSWNEKGNFHYSKGLENKGNIFLQGSLKKEDINGKAPNGFLCNKKLLVDENVIYNSKFTLADFEETEHMRSTTLEVGLVHDTNYKTDSDNTPSCFDNV
jgi:23S rRNA U2552 (ribose-2'-O)-methylase RlmE/FtsJ